jgi:hypothetical protein
VPEPSAAPGPKVEEVDWTALNFLEKSSQKR